MPDKTQRRFFQIHLSTAIVLMFVAGGLSYLNFTPELYEYGWTREYVQLMVSGGEGAYEIRRQTYYGWPFPFLTISKSTNDFGTYDSNGSDNIIRVPRTRVIDMSIKPVTDAAEFLKFLKPDFDPGERAPQGTTPYYKRFWDQPNVSFDGMVAFLIFIAVTLALELFIRRREARKL